MESDMTRQALPPAKPQSQGPPHSMGCTCQACASRDLAHAVIGMMVGAALASIVWILCVTDWDVVRIDRGDRHEHRVPLEGYSPAITKEIHGL